MKQIKQIKHIVLTITLLLFSLLGFSQTTPTSQVRVGTVTTTFNQNIPIGTQIYVMSDSTLWQARKGIAKTESVSSAIDDLILINNSVNFWVDQFEATGTIPSSTYALTYYPKIQTTGVIVMMNGAALRPTTDYTTLGHTLTIISVQSQYDVFVVSYTYYRP
jgi:hypothetical protein